MNAMAIPGNHELASRWADSRSITDDLFRIVRTESMYERPIAERHRIVFYLGHLEAFDWNLIAGQALGLGRAHKQFDRLFAFGIDPVGGGLPADQPRDWPGLAEIADYNLHVRRELDRILSDALPARANGWQFPRETVLNVAIEHRLMHAETLAYMLHQLPAEGKIAPENYRAATATMERPRETARMMEIPAGNATLGIPQGGENFGWDNEFKVHSVEVPAFAIDACKVTNGEFLQFMRAGGYHDRRFWSDADWDWIKARDITHPQFWRPRRGQWFYRAMFEEVPLPPAWPAYVSHAEASAYARFVGKALPTEVQFQRAAYGTAEGRERAYPWGEAAPDAVHGNFDFQRWDPVSVGSYPGGRSAFGLHDSLGNGWEWTSSLFSPFPGFEPFPFYRGYSADFFDDKHYVMKGASPRTGACMLRRSFRNWFQPHYQYVYAGFRCVNE